MVWVEGEFADEVLDLLGFGTGGDEDGVVGEDDDAVVDSDESDEGTVLGATVVDDVVGGIDLDEVTDGGIAGIVVGDMACEGGPGAEVIPSEGTVGDDDIGGFFEEGVVDADLADLGVFGGEDLAEVGRTDGGGLEPTETGGVHVGLVGLEALGDGIEGPDEHAGVPAVIAGGEVGDGTFEGGFLDELEGVEEGGGAGEVGEGSAGVDVAVAGGGFVGLDADGDHDGLGGGEVEGIGEHLLEACGIGDDVIGGEDGHDGVWRACADDGGAEGDGGAGIATDGFGDDVAGGEFGELTADFVGLGGAGDDEDMGGWDDWPDAVDCLLEEGAVAEEADELFWGFLAGDGPEAFTTATGHDDDVALGFGAGLGGWFGAGHGVCGRRFRDGKGADWREWNRDGWRGRGNGRRPRPER